MGAILAAKLLPETGGDTSWSRSPAYEALSEPFRRLLDGLKAVHDLAKAFPRERYGQGEEEAK